jgi:translocation protein SEC62
VPPCALRLLLFFRHICPIFTLSLTFVLVNKKMASPAGRPPLPGQQPTPAQIQAIQRQLAIDAEKNGMTVPQFIEFIKKKQAEAQQQGAQQQQGQPQPQPINPGPPNPAALALAKFLRSQDLKPRTCILNGVRKDMFKGKVAVFRAYCSPSCFTYSCVVKRALRALQSPAYAKARSKNPLLPEITDRASLENAFKLLPLSLLALRVSKIDPNEGHEGHNHAPPAKTKRVKGLWTVKIEQQQDCKEELHYVWLYEGSQIKTKLYAAGALLVIFAIVLFPLWPVKMRLGVWYLSMGMLGLIGLFFAMSIVRLIIWAITAIVLPVPWLLFPNLFEDGKLSLQFALPLPTLFSLCGIHVC